ncbi:MAG TPA: hypothetical protein VGS79_16620 [Puia sp.]|nr:hypothetical protein [Puia sp.]
MEALTKQLRQLRAFVAFLTVIVLTCLITIVFLLRNKGNREFDQLTAHRVNIVEPNGQLALVISDNANQHPGRINGKDLKPRDRGAGMIFFNTDGDECGGLVYDGTKKEAGMVLSIDQYKNDQIMQLQYQQDSGASLTRSYGFKLWDRSDRFTLAQELDYFDSLQNLHDTAALRRGEDTLISQGLMGRERLFLGRTKDGNTGLFLRDDKGVPRLRICVSKENKPLIQVLDDDGQPVATWDGNVPEIRAKKK